MNDSWSNAERVSSQNSSLFAMSTFSSLCFVLAFVDRQPLSSDATPAYSVSVDFVVVVVVATSVVVVVVIAVNTMPSYTHIYIYIYRRASEYTHAHKPYKLYAFDVRLHICVSTQKFCLPFQS